jgi:hypothetical protein
MRLLTGTKWGANSYTLRTIYLALIRSKIDYGCEVYNSAKLQILRKDFAIKLFLRSSYGGSPISTCKLANEAFFIDPVQIHRH